MTIILEKKENNLNNDAFLLKSKLCFRQKMSAYDSQVDGSHYKDFKIQPSVFINENKILFAEGNAIKYLCRHEKKGKLKDLEKAKHYIDMIIDRDYDNKLEAKNM